MSEPNSLQIESYIGSLLGPRYSPQIFDDIVAAAQSARIPSMSVSASQGQLLHVLVKMIGARRILEIGSLAGYSGVWLASALPPDGKMITLELEKRHADVARENFSRAGLSGRVELRLGPAAQSLDALIAENVQPFDLIFIDADKEGYVGYLDRALRLIRKGGVILSDNTLSYGVLQGNEESPIGIFNHAVAKDKRLTSAMVPVMKSPVDGFTISIVD